MAVSEQQRAENHARQLRQAQRQAARDIARDRVVGALDGLLAVGPPDWFTVDQVNAHQDELRRIRERIGESGVARVYRMSQPQRASR